MRKGLIIFSILTIFVLTLVLVSSAESLRQGVVEEIQGNVEVLFQGSEWQMAQEGMIVREGDELRAGEKSSAVILLDEGDAANKIELKPKSRLKMTTLEMDAITGEKITLLDLAIGKVLVHASKLQGESKFEVRTPTSTTGVRGTVFEVSVEEA